MEIAPNPQKTTASQMSQPCGSIVAMRMIRTPSIIRPISGQVSLVLPRIHWPINAPTTGCAAFTAINHRNNDEHPTNIPTSVAMAMNEPMNTPQKTSKPSPSDAPIFSPDCTTSFENPGVSRNSTIPNSTNATALTAAQNAELLPNSSRCRTWWVYCTGVASLAFLETNGSLSPSNLMAPSTCAVPSMVNVPPFSSLLPPTVPAMCVDWLKISMSRPTFPSMPRVWEKEVRLRPTVPRVSRAIT